MRESEQKSEREGVPMTTDEALVTLGLDRAATREDVLAAHRELTQMMHPDKYGSNKRLRARAERQMARINAARDELLPRAGSAARSAANAPRSADPPCSGTSSRTRPEGAYAAAGDPSVRAQRIRQAAQRRAHAAETARLAVLESIRTVQEIRHRAAGVLAVCALGVLIASRLRGVLGTLGLPVCSTLALWAICDLIRTSGQLTALRERARELLEDRDAAHAVAAGEV